MRPITSVFLCQVKIRVLATVSCALFSCFRYLLPLLPFFLYTFLLSFFTFFGACCMLAVIHSVLSSHVSGCRCCCCKGEREEEEEERAMSLPCGMQQWLVYRTCEFFWRFFVDSDEKDDELKRKLKYVHMWEIGGLLLLKWVKESVAEERLHWTKRLQLKCIVDGWLWNQGA